MPELNRLFGRHKNMQCHEIDDDIIGHDLRIVEIELDPRETVVAEAGAMNYMDEGISFEAKMGDGSNPSEGLMGGSH
jgi:uncharacterized protein (AIM24 family)